MQPERAELDRPLLDDLGDAEVRLGEVEADGDRGDEHDVHEPRQAHGRNRPREHRHHRARRPPEKPTGHVAHRHSILRHPLL